MLKRLSKEQKAKIYEAHTKGMSTRKAAECAGVNPRTVRHYWKKAGLEANFERGQPLPQEQIDKIYEAHTKGMSIKGAAEYAEVSPGAVKKYWEQKGLAYNFGMGGQPLSQEQIDKIYEAHAEGMSIKGSAEYAEVNQETVLRYWKMKGLEANFGLGRQPLPQEQIDKIYEAHSKGLSLGKAAEYAGVGASTVQKYWKKAGLEANFEWHSRKVSLMVLMDSVFDTEKNPDELLSIEDVKRRLGDKFSKIYLGDLEKRIAEAVRLGVYDEIRVGGEIKYKAGMPKAMDGMLEKECQKS